MTPKRWTLLLLVAGCGARSSLPGESSSSGDGGRVEPGGQGVGGAGEAGASPEVGGGGSGGSGGEAPQPCNGVTEEPCGTDVGECSMGVHRCQPDGFFGPCEGGIEPTAELCNGLDDNCDGAVDEDFGVGQPCDGPDNDACFDDVMTCGGCTQGPDILETCNGVDDNCNGIIDADCDVGGCSPTLRVTGSTPSSPGCIDLPVEAGSIGIIEYPCEGGDVVATLGNITFSGSVIDGQVNLSGTEQIIGPDGCTWQNDHFITGSIPSGVISYFYQETLIAGGNCWQPCTESGTVEITWE